MSADTAHVGAGDSPVIAGSGEAKRVARRKLWLAVGCVLLYAVLINVPVSTALAPTAQRALALALAPCHCTTA